MAYLRESHVEQIKSALQSWGNHSTTASGRSHGSQQEHVLFTNIQQASFVSGPSQCQYLKIINSQLAVARCRCRQFWMPVRLQWFHVIHQIRNLTKAVVTTTTTKRKTCKTCNLKLQTGEAIPAAKLADCFKFSCRCNHSTFKFWVACFKFYVASFSAVVLMAQDANWSAS